jgi:hypothetical protein
VRFEPNTRYVLAYDSRRELSIDESEDSRLTGYTVIAAEKKDNTTRFPPRADRKYEIQSVVLQIDQSQGDLT